MSKKGYELELAAAKAPEWVYPIIEDLFTVFGKQGHSGGSHGMMISGMRAWLKNVIPITDEKALLSPLSTVLFRLGIPEDRELVLGYFVKLANNECLAPLTGEDDEWMVHHMDKDTAQNRRMGSVFKNLTTGKAYWLDGRTFCNLSPSFKYWLGWGGYYSATDVTFPWTPPEVERVYYIDEYREVTLPGGADPEGYKHAHFFKSCAGYEAGPYIIPKAFFIKPEDQEELVIAFNAIVKATPDFSFPNKLKALEEVDRLTWSDEEDQDEDLMLELRHEYAGIWVCKRVIFPLLRLLACVPESVTINAEGEICGYRGSKWEPEFQVPYCPTAKFQDWQPLKGKYAGYLSVRLDQNSGIATHLSRLSKAEEINKSYFDRVGYEIRYVEDADYLYAMRRRFNIKHPKSKVRVAHPNDAMCDNAMPCVDSPNPE